MKQLRFATLAEKRCHYLESWLNADWIRDPSPEDLPNGRSLMNEVRALEGGAVLFAEPGGTSWGDFARAPIRVRPARNVTMRSVALATPALWRYRERIGWAFEDIERYAETEVSREFPLEKSRWTCGDALVTVLRELHEVRRCALLCGPHAFGIVEE